jgi:hypothetical protein
VSEAIDPPLAETVYNPPVTEPNTMTPPVLQVPPAKLGKPTIEREGPPDESMLFKVLLATEKNPSVRLSGDQNGIEAVSVSLKRVASSASKERIQSSAYPPVLLAMYARCRPSGAIAGINQPATGLSATFCEGSTVKRIGCASVATGRRKYNVAKTTAAVADNAVAARIQARVR